MLDYGWEVGAFLLRWLHVVAAIAWIGESFYFVMLDRALRPGPEPRTGVVGELWSVHGGGFYHKQKYQVAPGGLPPDLHWSKWKSYTTWLSGFVLFSALYLRDPSVFLVDPDLFAMSGTSAALIALAFIAGGWIVYDLLCRIIGFHDRWLGLAVGGLTLGLCLAATTLFSGRAAFLLVGGVLATIMSANVYFIIIPGQKRMVAALARGEAVDPLPGRRGKQRSVHNTYFTLPVVFTMLSPHFSIAHAHPHNGWILAGILLAAALMRQFFVLWHSGGRAWWLLASGGVLLLGLLYILAPAPIPAAPPRPVPNEGLQHTDAPIEDTPSYPDQPSTADILPILHRHCGNCHAQQPRMMASAPLGLKFDTPLQAERQLRQIHQQTVVLKIMPPGNLTGMTTAERDAINRWAQTRLRSAP